MARHEQDREDLLREAVALQERIELRLDHAEETLVVGFRRDSSGSIYVGAELVFQFNSRGEFRRGYFERRLLKAEHGRIVALERLRTADATCLMRSDFSDAQTAAFAERFQVELANLMAALDARRFTVVGQVPADADVLGRVVGWLPSLAGPLRIADVPNVG